MPHSERGKRRPAPERRRASLKLDRVFPGVGRLVIHSGTPLKGVFREINAMLTSLYVTGRYDVLTELREAAKRPLGQRLTPLFLLDAYRRGRLDQLPSATALRPLVAGFRAWAAGGNTRKGQPWSRWYAAAHRSLEHRVIGKARVGATVMELPAILAGHRRAYAGRRKTFDNDRAIFLGFARDVCGRHSTLYLQVAAVEPYRPRRMQATHPQTVAELLAWTDATASSTGATLPAKLDAETAACCWAMATTGMGPGEYWGRWERRLDRIAIHGTKREARERAVPDLGQCSEPPAISRQAFEDRLAEQTDGAFKPYDLRRTFANWLEDAGLRRTRVKLYLGHAIRDVTDLYTDHDVTQFLRDDAKLLRGWIAKKRTEAAFNSHRASHQSTEATRVS